MRLKGFKCPREGNSKGAVMGKLLPWLAEQRIGYCTQ